MTRKAILRAWPGTVPALARPTLWLWLNRLVREGRFFSLLPRRRIRGAEKRLR